MRGLQTIFYQSCKSNYFSPSSLLLPNKYVKHFTNCYVLHFSGKGHIHKQKAVEKLYKTSMLPSKVMSYLFWLAAPLMDSSIVLLLLIKKDLYSGRILKSNSISKHYVYLKRREDQISKGASKHWKFKIHMQNVMKNIFEKSKKIQKQSI